jgi:hypothetical protein
MQRVPGEVNSALDSLAPYVRQTSTGLNDRTDQASPDHRTTSQPVDIVGGHSSGPSVVVEIGEPAVLQPTAADQVSGLAEDFVHVIELGEPCTGFVLKPQLSDTTASDPPARAVIFHIDGPTVGRQGGDCHGSVPP